MICGGVDRLHYSTQPLLFDIKRRHTFDKLKMYLKTKPIIVERLL